MVAAAFCRSALSTSCGDLFFFLGGPCFFAFFDDDFCVDDVAGRFIPGLLDKVFNGCFFVELPLELVDFDFG